MFFSERQVRVIRTFFAAKFRLFIYCAVHLNSILSIDKLSINKWGIQLEGKKMKTTNTLSIDGNVLFPAPLLVTTTSSRNTTTQSSTEERST